MIGQQVGDYKILSPIGEEAMGMVYLGEHVLLKQKVAVKALDPKLLSAEGMKERFEREAQVMARLNHPNIIRLLNFYNLPEGCFIVMEFAEGQTLEDMVQRKGPIPIAEAVPWMIQVLSALQHAHEKEIIHRDLKPANVLITNAGIARVLDFGLAKVSDAPTLTMQGLTIGTVHYMSREQLMGKAVDARADVYAAGVTLYEITTGRLPFEEKEERKLVLKIAKQDPPPPTTYLPAMPPELEKIILKALQKEPAQRFQKAIEMAQALEAFLEGVKRKTAGDFVAPALPAGAEPAPAPAPPPPPPPPPPAPVKPATARLGPAFPSLPDGSPFPATTEVPAMGNLPRSTQAVPIVQAPAPGASLLSPLLVTGLGILAGSAGLAVAVFILEPSQKLVLALALGMGVPLGLVLAVVAVLRSLSNTPRS